MEWVYSDGGRSKYFKAAHVGDCVTRAIANATGMDYKDVYDGLKELAKKERITKRNPTRSTVRDGVRKQTIRKYMEQIGWVWCPTMKVGSGCTVHIRADELPAGTLVVQVSRHLTCVKDGVIYDTFNPSDRGCAVDGYGNDITTERCVYGYYVKGDGKPAPKKKPEKKPAPKKKASGKPLTARQALENRGALYIEGYTLVNNYGYRFEYAGREMDARFWANCYGCYIGRWEIMVIDRRDGETLPAYLVKWIKKTEEVLNVLGDE